VRSGTSERGDNRDLAAGQFGRQRWQSIRKQTIPAIYAARVP